MAKKTNRPSVKNMNYIAAANIIRSYNENSEPYLRSMVRAHVPDAENVLACADRKNLLYHTRTIKGVAKRINDSNIKISEKNQDLLVRIKSLPDIKNPEERSLADERICMQLEGRNIPVGCNLSNAYVGTKNMMQYSR